MQVREVHFYGDDFMKPYRGNQNLANAIHESIVYYVKLTMKKLDVQEIRGRSENKNERCYFGRKIKIQNCACLF